jgi:hypothetical protein
MRKPVAGKAQPEGGPNEPRITPIITISMCHPTHLEVIQQYLTVSVITIITITMSRSSYLLLLMV